eukprot:gene2015-1522_t
MTSLPKKKESEKENQNDDITSKIKLNFAELEKDIEEEKNDQKIIQENVEKYKKTKQEEPEIQYPKTDDIIPVEVFDASEDLSNIKKLNERRFSNRVKNIEDLKQQEINPYSKELEKQMGEKEDIDIESIKQTKPSYMNIFLLNEDDILKRFGNRQIDYDNHFYTLTFNLYHAHSKLFQSREKMKSLKDSIESQSYNIYQEASVVTTSQEALCGDEVPCSGNVTTVISQIEIPYVEKLSTLFEELRELHFHDIIKQEFDVELCRFRINYYLDMIYKDIEKREKIEDLKNCLSILFQFEQKTHNMLTTSVEIMDNEYLSVDGLKDFRNDVRTWIIQMCGFLVKVADIDDTRFVIFELIRCRFIGEWGNNIIQLSSVQNDNDIDFFIAVLSVFLTPIYFNSENDKKDYILTEEDYQSLWSQFPIIQFVNYLFKDSKEIRNSRFYDWKVSFDAMETIIYILQKSLAIFNIPSHVQFAREIGQSIVRIIQIVNNAVKSSYHHPNIHKLYNTFFIKAFLSIYKSATDFQELGLWGFLPDFPYDSISNFTASLLFLTIFTDQHNISAFCSLEEWIAFNKKDTHHREFFTNLMNIGAKSSYLIHTLKNIACNSSPNLAWLIVYELFLMSQINECTRDQFSRDGSYAIVDICEKFPCSIKVVLPLTLEHFPIIEHSVISFYKQIPIAKLSYTKNEIKIFSKLLIKPLDSIECKLGQFIVDNLVWHEETKVKLWNTKPQMQRTLVLALVDCLNHHRKNSKGYWSKTSVMFTQWMWKIVLKLNFYNDEGIPYLIPLEINHPDLATLTKNVLQTEGQSSLEFDSLSAFLLFSISEVGSRIDQFDEIGRRWLELMIYWKHYQPAMRLLSDLSIRKQFVLNFGKFNFQPWIEAIIETDTDETLVGNTIGRIVNVKKVIGEKTLQLCQSILHVIDTFASVSINQTAISRLVIFWIDEFLNVPNWSQDPRSWYGINEICNICLSLNIHEDISKFLQGLDELKTFSYGKTSFFSFMTMKSKVETMSLFEGAYFSKPIKPNENHYISFLYFLGLAKEEKYKRLGIIEDMSNKKYPFEKAASKKGYVFVIYRILAHCFELTYDMTIESDHSFILNFWKLFFDLYFESKKTKDSIDNFGSFFLDITPRDSIFGQLIDRLTDLSSFYKKLGEDDKKYEVYDKIYYAMNLWVKHTEKNCNSFLKKINELPEYYCSDYLIGCIEKPLFNENSELIIKKEHNQHDYVLLSNIYPSLYLKSITKKKIERKKPVVRVSYVPQDEIKKLKPTMTNQILENYQINSLSIDNFNIDVILKNGKLLTESLNKLIEIDNEYIKLIPLLYENKEILQELELSCIRGPFCADPVKVQFNAPTKVENQGVKQSISVNRSIAKNLFEQNYIMDELKNYLKYLELVIIEIVQKNDVKLGTAWFYAIATYYNNAIKEFPPIKISLNSLLQVLGNKFVLYNSEETFNVLTLMLEKHTRIKLLNQYFNPAMCPQLMVRIFENIYAMKKKFTAEVILPLYKRIIISDWFPSFPSLEDRKNLIDHCFMVIVQYYYDLSNGKKLSDAEMEIYHLYIKYFNKLIEYNFPELFEYSYHFIINGVVDSTIPPDVVKDLVHLPYEKLTPEIYLTTMLTTKDELWKLRKKKNTTLYKCCPDYLKALVGIVKGSSLSQKDLDAVWGGVSMGLEPWIFTMASNEFYENDKIENTFVLPWSSSTELSDASFVVNSLMDVLVHLQSMKTDIQELTWDLYIRLTKTSPFQILDVYHRFLLRIDWKSFFITVPQMQVMFKILKNSKGESDTFMWNLFLIIPWKTIENSNDDEKFKREFFLTLSQITFKLLHKKSNVKNPIEKLKKVLSSIYWDEMNNDDFITVIQTVEETYVKSSQDLKGDIKFITIESIFDMLPKVITESNLEKVLYFIQLVFNVISMSEMNKQIQKRQSVTPIQESEKKYLSYFDKILSMFLKCQKNEKISTLILKEIFKIYNFSSSIFEKMITKLQDLISQNPKLFVPLMNSSQYVIPSVDKLASVVELIMFSHFKESKDWDIVFKEFVSPETSIKDFLQSCLENGHGLVLYAY